MLDHMPWRTKSSRYRSVEGVVVEATGEKPVNLIEAGGSEFKAGMRAASIATTVTQPRIYDPGGGRLSS
jgi:hypothetical protein